MRTKGLIIALALVLAGVSAVLAARYVSSARTEVASSSRPVEVLVAQEDIPRGLSAEELIAKKMIALQEVPQRFVAAGAISSSRAIDGQVLSAPLTKGEQVTSARFEVPSAAGLAYSVSKDQVAIAISVDEVRGISQLVSPGDRVAIFATFEEAGKNKEDTTKLLLSEAKVLAMGGNMSSRPAVKQGEGEGEEEGGGAFAGGDKNQQENVPHVMTLAVTAEQAEKLVFAEETGRIWVALLPATAEDAPSTPGQTIRTVLR